MQVITIERPQEYLQALEELKKSFVRSIDIVQKLHDLGVKYGLSKQDIRKDIEESLAGIVKPRQLRSILPLELKDIKKTNKKPHAAVAAASPVRSKQFEFRTKITPFSGERYAIIMGKKTKNEIKPWLGREITVTIS